MGARPRVGFPARVEHAYGAERSFEGRKHDFRQAEGWTKALFPGAQLHPFYFSELPRRHLVVSGVLLAEASPGADGAGLEWREMVGLAEGNSAMLELAELALARARTFREPAPLFDGAKTGALAERRLDPRPVLRAATAHPRQWANVLAEAQAVIEHQRAALERRIEAEGNKLVREDLAGWLAICNQPLRLADITPALQASCLSASAPDAL
jgi:hypothetical protein